MRAEDFSCSLEVLNGGLEISKLQFLIKKIHIYFRCKMLQILVIKTLNPDPHGLQNAGSGSALKRIRIRNTVCFLFFQCTGPVVDVVEVSDSVLGPYDEVQEDGSHIQPGNKLMLQHSNRFYHPNFVLRWGFLWIWKELSESRSAIAVT